MWKAILLATALVLPLPPLLAGEEEPPPTPAERVAELKGDCAKKHVRLASFAKGKKLGRAAKAHLMLALRLDPDCRTARSRLGHRKSRDGTWSTDREKEFRDGKGAWEKHSEAFLEKERDLLGEECSAFLELGKALMAENEAEVGRRLLERVVLLDPGRSEAVSALGLVPLKRGFVEKDSANVLTNMPVPADAGVQGMAGRILGISTVVRRCGAVEAETLGMSESADRVAREVHRGHLYTTQVLGVPPRGTGWLIVSVVPDMVRFSAFLDGTGMQEPWLSACKKLGTTRGAQPRLFAAAAAANPEACTGLFIHCAAEIVLFQEFGQELPAWLYESSGVDACLAVLGQPGPVCIPMESSAGLVMKGNFSRPETWAPLLLRRAATGDIVHLESLFTAQIQALGTEDLMVAHAFYRYLFLTAPDGLREFLRGLSREEEQTEAFEQAFNAGPREIEEEWASLYLGG
jgi:hypothetical protein